MKMEKMGGCAHDDVDEAVKKYIEEFKTVYQQTEILNDTFGRRRHPRICEECARANPLQISVLNSVYALLLQNQIVGRSSNISNGETICRICFGGASNGRLVRPCGCRGTIAAVHRNCLERWLLQASTSYCELCGHHYSVVRTHKWSFFRSLREWMKSQGGKAFVADLWRAAALGTTSILETARALQACEKLQQVGSQRGGSVAVIANVVSSVMIGVIGALNGLLASWVLLKIQEHQTNWQLWRDSTLHLRVVLNDEENRTPEQSITMQPSSITENEVENVNDDTARSPSIMSFFTDLNMPT